MTENEQEYWEDRYLNKGTSGPGSRGYYKKKKWDIINQRIPPIHDVIDVGCGDLAFWEGVECKKYIGIDISETIINRNRQLKPRWTFFHRRAEEYIPNLKAETVFCIDILFHIMEHSCFTEILKNLCKYTSKYLVIYTWDENPFSRIGALRRLRKRNLYVLKYILSPSTNDGKYQYFRKLDGYFSLFESRGLKLTHKERLDHFGALYFFTRKEFTAPAQEVIVGGIG